MARFMGSSWPQAQGDAARSAWLESCSICKVKAASALDAAQFIFPSSSSRQSTSRLHGCAVLEACGALSHSDQDAAAETCLLLSLTEALLQEREGSHHNPTSLLEKTGLQGTGSSPVVLAQSEQDGHAEAVTAGSSESQLDKPVISSAEAQLEKAIIHALKCLSKGGDKLQVAEVAQRVTGFVLASFDRMVAACNPAVWEAALQVQAHGCPEPAA